MTDKKKEGESIVDKVSMLKKAGLPTAAVLLIVAMGFPGFWEFFRGEGTEAKVKAEVAYQLLKVQAEGIAKQVEQQSVEIEQLRETVNAILLQRSAVGMSSMQPPAEPEMQPEPPMALALTPLPPNLDAAAAMKMAEQKLAE